MTGLPAPARPWPRRPAPRAGWRLAARCLAARCLAVLVCWLLPGLLAGAAAAQPALQPVTLQLNDRHDFAFAGYYAAEALGYYRDAGLAVTLREAGDATDVARAVADGRAQFGVGTSSLLLDRQRGLPVVVLAVLFQHSPRVLLARAGSATQGLHDLVGRRVMVEPKARELLAYLAREGVPQDWLLQLPHSHDLGSLLRDEVDAMSADLSSAPFALDAAGLRHQVYTPRAAGIDFYGDNLFTAEALLRQRPELVKAFREASLRGWRHAMDHPDEVIALILQRYPPAGHAAPGREALAYQARRLRELMQPDLVEIGYMYPGRWQHAAEAFADAELLPRDFAVAPMLYQPGPRPAPPWLVPALGALVVLGAVALYIGWINRRLARALAASRLAADTLRLSEQRHRLLADHASDVIWVLDLQGRFTYVSPSVTRLSGHAPAELLGRTLPQAMAPGSAPQAAALLAEALAAMAAGAPCPEFRGELELACKDGSTVWTEVGTSGLRNDDGRYTGLLGVSRDIGERRRAEQRMRHMAQHDPLTGLPNRALFSDRLHLALAAARRDRMPLALMFVDLDHFKPVNDRHGHAVGDALLRQVALRMQQAVRASDTVARIGGDEFVVLLRSVDTAAHALAVARKLGQALARPVDVGDQALQVSASIGVALCPDHGDDELALSRAADLAMYAAKQAGRNQVRLAPLPGPAEAAA